MPIEKRLKSKILAYSDFVLASWHSLNTFSFSAHPAHKMWEYHFNAATSFKIGFRYVNFWSINPEHAYYVTSHSLSSIKNSHSIHLKTECKLTVK